MLVRASAAAAVVLVAGMSVYSLNLRQTYDEMYPADGLKRDAFGICHSTDQTFIRAIRSDRIGCYDRMPNSFALAIGWARHGSGLAAPPPPSLGILETADLFLSSPAAQPPRERAAAAGLRPCADGRGEPLGRGAARALTLADAAGANDLGGKPAQIESPPSSPTLARPVLGQNSGIPNPTTAALPKLVAQPGLVSGLMGSSTGAHNATLPTLSGGDQPASGNTTHPDTFATGCPSRV